jgi:hypothetical protein
MTWPVRYLENLDRKAPGFLEACIKIGKQSGGLLEIDPDKFNGLREKFGLSRGLGDTIAKVTKALGVKPCSGCKKRRDKLNDMLPYS